MVAFKKVLFPTDFSPNADKALRHAIRLADIDDGEVIVQHVVGNYFEKHPHWATLFDLHEMQKYMDGYVDLNMAKVLPKNPGNVRVRTEVSKGKPAEEIIAAGFDAETVRKVLRLVRTAEFKRKQAAPGLKVTDRAFGTGWRMPIAARLTDGV